jgi:hypothetical protein
MCDEQWTGMFGDQMIDKELGFDMILVSRQGYGR